MQHNSDTYPGGPLNLWTTNPSTFPLGAARARSCCPAKTRLLGEQTMRGLPFTVGAPGGDPDGNCYISLAEGRCVGKRCRSGKPRRAVVFAHRQMETEQDSNGPVGVHVADYVVRFVDSETVTMPIRERYEISVVSDRQGISRFGIGFPYLAVTDQEDTLMPRYEGRFDLIGRRQTESVQAQPAWYWLWAWSNPTPDRVIESIEFVPTWSALHRRGRHPRTRR